jgi:predicted RNA binding protein YcfA (HicA-like mRNA interferase family)
MPPFGPIKRRDLISALKQFDFEGPFPGGNHQYMSKGQLKVHIPNPHRGDISKGLLAQILTEAGISREEWESF